MLALIAGAGMKRREFLSFLGGATAAQLVAPRLARGQPTGRARRVGILLGSYSAADPAGQVRIGILLKTLRERGWEDGRNLHIDYHWGAGNSEQISKLVVELVQSAPDAIIATSDPAIAQFHKLTSAIPIIFTQTSEPVESGIVASLARPGGNMTGFQNFEPAIGGKWLEVLKEVAPGLTNAGAVFSADAAAHAQFLKSAQSVAPALGMTVTLVDIQGDLERAITAYAEQPDRGLLVFPHPKTIANRRLINSLAVRHRAPAIYPYRYFAGDGGLITYGPDQLDQWRGAALYLDRILKGENPAGLPVQTPTKYELAINVKAAKAIGLTISPRLIAGADEVIE
jgi:putative tryptophan/tyrosine transport system substrate-binding protein